MAHIRLHVKQAEGGLPMVCMCCGEPAKLVKAKKLSYYPRWLMLLVLVGVPGLILLLILALILRRRALLQAPLCDRHQNHWTMRVVIGWVAAVGVIVAAVVGGIAIILLENGNAGHADIVAPFLCAGGSFAFIGLLILLAILQNTSIRPDEITRTHILLNGVSEAFVTAVEEAEIERRVRLRQWEVEDEADRAPRSGAKDFDPYQSKPVSNEAFEEDRRRPAPPTDAFETENGKNDPNGPATGNR